MTEEQFIELMRSTNPTLSRRKVTITASELERLLREAFQAGQREATKIFLEGKKP